MPGQSFQRPLVLRPSHPRRHLCGIQVWQERPLEHPDPSSRCHCAARGQATIPLDTPTLLSHQGGSSQGQGIRWGSSAATGVQGKDGLNPMGSAGASLVWGHQRLQEARRVMPTSWKHGLAGHDLPPPLLGQWPTEGRERSSRGRLGLGHSSSKDMTSHAGRRDTCSLMHVSH